MTLLGALFSKKYKVKHSRSTIALDGEGTDSVSSSPSDSYVTPDMHGPSVPNGSSYLHPSGPRTHLNGTHSSQETMPSSSSSSATRLRLPFGRKKLSKPLSSGPPEEETRPLSPRPPFMGRASMSSTNAASDTESFRRLRPPPSKSAIFAAYADPNSALSTRSLPNDHHHHHIHSDLSLGPPPRQSKRPSLFAWTKSAPNKKLPKPPRDEGPVSPVTSSNDHADSSFNLKSFRHVVSSSPTRSNASNVSLSAPTPRPRGESVNSDTTQQRISVAAFREAQARRSMAGSPSPSTGRSPSPLPSPALGGDAVDRGRGGPRPSRSSPHIPQTSPTQSYYQQPLQHRRKSGMSIAATSSYASDSDESHQSDEGEESEDDRTYTKGRLVRRGTVKSNVGKDGIGKVRAKSEMGHGTFTFSAPFIRRDNAMIPSGPSKSHLGHGNGWGPPNSPQAPPSFLASPPQNSRMPLQAQQSSTDNAAGLRQRASNSASALTPSAAAKRASIVAAANAANEADSVIQYKRASRHIRDSSIHSNPGEPPEAPAKKAASHLGHGGYSPRTLKMDSSDSDSDSDNAPLATLVPPRRPGSALSSYSTGNLSVRSGGGIPHKPLIDIKELTGGSTSANKSGTAPTILTASAKNMGGFTGGRTLLADLSGSAGSNIPKPSSSPSSPPAPSPSFHPPHPSRVESPLSMTQGVQQVTSRVPPFKFASPTRTPVREDVKTLGMAPRSATLPIVGGSSLAGSGSGSERELSPEAARRDALAERLSRAVKKTVDVHTPTSSAASPLGSPTLEPAAAAAAGEISGRPQMVAVSSPLARGKTTSPELTPMSAPIIRESPISPTPTTKTSMDTTTPSPFSKGGQQRPSMGASETTAPAIVTKPQPQPQKHQIQQPQQQKLSPPDQSLADLLGAGIRLITLTGESDESDSDRSDEGSEESEDNYGYDSIAARRIRAAQTSSSSGGAQGEKQNERTLENGEEEEERQGKITPIPIKQRTPLPSFSVTSRPQFPRRPDAPQQQPDGSATSSVSGGSSNSNGSVMGVGDKSQRESVASSYSVFGVTGSADANANANANAARKRSSTLIPTSPVHSSSGLGNSNNSNNSNNTGNRVVSNGQVSGNGDRTNALRAVGATVAMQPRQRSSTMLPMMPSASGVGPSGVAAGKPNIDRPFAIRRDSPASSTGDSSSGRAPLTPRDGSDIGLKEHRDSRGGRVVDVDQYSGGASGLGISTKAKGKQIKRRSVSFEDDLRDVVGSGGNSSGGNRGGARGGSRDFLSKGEPVPVVKRSSEQQLEERRKERRREEAKAAIELGNVINGRGPVVDDDEGDMPINQVNQRMSTMNPMMMSPMGMQQQQQQQPPMGYVPGPQGPMPPAGPWGIPGMNMNMNMNPGLLSPAQFMVPPPSASDASFLAAHQQAMMYAKQAYQMAVAQQAMAAAADEWERSSNVGGFGGSVYGGSNAGSSMMMPFGMMGPMPPMGGGGMNNMGMMGGAGGNNWSTGSGIFPSSRSMYNANINSSRSDYGGGGMNAGGLTPNWTSSRSSYGDYGPSTTMNGGRLGGVGAGGRDQGLKDQRGSMYANNPPVPPLPQSPSSKSSPRMRTISQPTTPPHRTTGTGPRKPPPPSSWKQGF